MPFLIKSVNGKRSYQMVTNNSKQDSEEKLRESVIRALKGLTFKFEVKITDVVSSDATTPVDVPVEASSTTVQTNHDVSINGFSDGLNFRAPKSLGSTSNSAEKVEVKHERLESNGVAESSTTRPKTTYQREELLALNKKPVTFDVGSQEKSPEPKSMVTRVDAAPMKDEAPKEVAAPKKDEDPKKDVAQVAVVNNKQSSESNEKKALPPTKPKFPRGSMKIGTQMRTICVAVDENIKPPVAYIAYDSQEIANITSAITDISNEIESEPEITSVQVGDIVFAKSIEDNNWYRAIVEGVKEQVYIQVHYFDWGLGETLSMKRIKRLNRLELGLSKHPACAVKVVFDNEPDQKLDDVLSCQVEFNMKVLSYDEASQIYNCTITG